MTWGTHFQSCHPEKLHPAATRPWKCQHLQGSSGVRTRTSQTPRQATQCGQTQAEAEGRIPGYRLLNLPEPRKYEPGEFCPQASVLWTKLRLRGLLLSFASTSHIYLTGAFLTFYRRNRMPNVGPVRERDGSAPSPALSTAGRGSSATVGRLLTSGMANYGTTGPVFVHLSP